MTSSSVENLIKAANGPKVSSPVINCAPGQPSSGDRRLTQSLETLVRTVGMNSVRLPLLPPTRTLAPFETASSTCYTSVAISTDSLTSCTLSA